ncbi:MAG: hypothetical protein GXN99_00195 [Candidatus Nanohaloarchaeota archaeon]|nr:hypothetical protein [Candidatus Nanohaloarchaeota archaeon]
MAKRKGQFYIIGAILLSFFFYTFISELIISDSVLTHHDASFQKIKKVDEIIKQINKKNQEYLFKPISIIEHATSIQEYLNHIKQYYNLENIHSSYLCSNYVCKITVVLQDNDVRLTREFHNLPYRPDKSSFIPPNCDDEDGDGLISIFCGGSDCDDNDPNVINAQDGTCDGDYDGYLDNSSVIGTPLNYQIDLDDTNPLIH